MPAPVVRREYGPSLPELLGPRVRALPATLRLGLVALLAFLGVAVLVSLLSGGGGDRTSYVHRGDPAFNLSYPKLVDRVAPKPGETLRLEQRRGKLFLASFAVEPLRLPAYSGVPDGVFPAFAEHLKTQLAARFADYEDVAPEGRVRLNEITAGYSVLFRAHLGDRRLYGRAVMLTPPEAGQRDTVLLLMLATPAAAISGPEAVGNDGSMSVPYRSFRFGTERP